MAKEYIEREAAIKICSNQYKECLRKSDWCGDTVAWNIGFGIKAIPAADVVAVVRCKDCKWYEPIRDCGIDEATGRRDHSKVIEKPYGECHGQDFNFTEDGVLRVAENDFCSNGERRGKDV